MFVGPILLSTDVFSYIAYARMGVEHGLNPYTARPVAIVARPRLPLRRARLAARRHRLRPALHAALLSARAARRDGRAVGDEARWRCSRAPARSRSRGAARACAGSTRCSALLAVGANPLYVIYGLGGAHNDLLMMLADDGRRRAHALARPRRGAAARGGVVAGALVKATVAALLPFMILARRRLAPVARRARARSRSARSLAYAAFGVHGINIVAALNRDAAFVSTDSFPTEIAHLFGKPGVFPIDHDLLKAALVLIVLHLLWRTWRGYDWVAASGWALLAISVTSTWLLAWYILWPLPLAVDQRATAACSSPRSRAGAVHPPPDLAAARAGVMSAPPTAPQRAPWRWLARRAAPAPHEREEPARRRLWRVETTCWCSSALLLAIATVNDVVLQTHINHRLDRRPAHVARLHRPRLQERRPNRSCSTHDRRDVVCGNTSPAAERARRSACALSAARARCCRRRRRAWCACPSSSWFGATFL